MERRYSSAFKKVSLSLEAVSKPVRRFLLADSYPLVLAIIAFFGILLDVVNAYEVYISNKKIFLDSEFNLIAKYAFGSSMWYAPVILYSLFFSIILIVAYMSKRPDVRYLTLAYSLLPYAGVLSWYINIGWLPLVFLLACSGAIYLFLRHF
jgi:hypothetical protein